MRISISIFLIAISSLQYSQAQGVNDSEAAPAYAQTGADGCLLCHNNPTVNQILNTPHAREADQRTPFAGQQCESCHGPSLDHISGMGADGKRPAPGIVFGTQSGTYPITDIEEQNEVCTGCHNGRSQQDWHGSQHQFADLSCSSCHSLHTAVDRLLEKTTQAEVCYECHAQQRSQALRPSSHPLVEGLMSCTDCHNPHGSPAQSMLAENTVNETCYVCHTEKRGPFLWEHQPVRENCSNCHEPHGATQSAMLRLRLPFLCNTCHSAARHPSNLRSGTGLPPLGLDRNLLGSSCANCHTQVHGTNHPAGTGLTR